MIDERGAWTDEAIGALHEELMTAFQNEDHAAVKRVRALLEVGMDERALAVVASALEANAQADMIAAHLLFQIHDVWDTGHLEPTFLVGLARRAFDAHAMETLASILSILANRAWTIRDVSLTWIDAALEYDLAAGHACRALTLGDLRSAWPHRDALRQIAKVEHQGRCC